MKTLLRVLEGTSFTKFRPVQESVLALSIDSPSGNIFEIPTGEGKSLIGAAIALNDSAEGRETYIVTPTKAQVDQIGNSFPKHTKVVFGRSEYPCLFYEDQGETVNAKESPCYMLKCPHRVDQQTGLTTEEGATPCPYYQAKYDAMVGRDRGTTTVCTTAFFLSNRLFARTGSEEESEDGQGTGIVFDEGHNLAKIARGIYEFTLTDYHLKRAEEALLRFDPTQAKIVRRFRLVFMRMARTKRSKTKNLLEISEVETLMDLLAEFKSGDVQRAVQAAMAEGKLDATRDRKELKLLEDMIRNIPAFVRSMRYSLPEQKSDGGQRHPLNFVVAFYYKGSDPEIQDPRHKTQYYLTIKAYYVVPLIRRVIGDDARVTVMSATIGDPNIFGHETGLRMPFTSFPSSFDATKTRIYLPSDTPNLSSRKMRRDDPKKARKMVIGAVTDFAEAKQRCLILVPSNEERWNYIRAAAAAGLTPISYDDEITPRQAVGLFKEGLGDCLIGTTAQFGEGLDLPAGICPVIFIVKPSYPPPDDPMSQFELKRFTTSHCWSLWNYRVMLEALQVRGRNIRTPDDIGVCFFVSQQFGYFLYGSLPAWLKPAYVGKEPLSAMVEDALSLLKGE
jgi:Rad3-related DNA helicase